MTKYNKREIMRNAWNIRKNANVNMSVALKAAWAQAELVAVAEKEAAACDWKCKVIVNDWAKGSHNRTYISLRIYTNAWNCKKEIRFGYIDNMTGNHVAA